eukprot:m.11512 g.11512  ORF g.11512 m.11512 type:complete len:651 (-) comp3852_c0_seq1:220-2172(-)
MFSFQTTHSFPSFSPGVVLHNTPIVVDVWTSVPGARLFFLSHMHADHTKGLTSTWNAGKIYCTAISKRLLCHKFNIDPSLVIEMEYNETMLVNMDCTGEELLCVKAINANHCAGAAMFLFQGYFGNVLCTGDFRFSNSQLIDLDGISIDHLFLDNSFCNPTMNHPSQEIALNMLFETIDENEGSDIVIGIDTLGKEEVLLAIHQKYNMPVHVSTTQFERYVEIEELPAQAFTTDVYSSRFHIVMKMMLNERYLKQLTKDIDFPCIGIVLSAFCPGHDLPTSSSSNTIIHNIQYSLHSNFEELKDFVTRINPKKSLSPLIFDEHLLPQRHFPANILPKNTSSLYSIDIPPSVEEFMERRGHSLKGHIASKLQRTNSHQLLQQQQQKGILPFKYQYDATGVKFDALEDDTDEDDISVRDEEEEGQLRYGGENNALTEQKHNKKEECNGGKNMFKQEMVSHKNATDEWQGKSIVEGLLDISGIRSTLPAPSHLPHQRMEKESTPAYQRQKRSGVWNRANKTTVTTFQHIKNSNLHQHLQGKRSTNDDDADLSTFTRASKKEKKRSLRSNGNLFKILLAKHSEAVSSSQHSLESSPQQHDTTCNSIEKESQAPRCRSANDASRYHFAGKHVKCTCKRVKCIINRCGGLVLVPDC